MESDTVPTLQLIGSIDRIDAEAIEGWTTVVGLPNMKIVLDVLLEGNPIGKCVADLYREDLDEARIGDGRCAFSFAMPAFVPASSFGRIRLRIAGSPAFLELPTKSPAESEHQHLTRATVSRFGGLWIDRADFVDQLGAKHRRGEISDEVSDQIWRFVRDGYVVLTGAVSSSILAQLNADIDRVWVEPPEGIMIETFEPDRQMRYIKPDIRWRAGATKLLDLYARSLPARVAISAPKVVDFLRAIFEDAPKAFQGLAFWNGSQQAIHKDTAYVKIDSNPLNLAATWLALEDIQPGSGELEYYVGSHRAPDFLFGGTSKWMEAHADEHDSFLASLHEDARKFGHIRRSFLATAGDVLVWHADLAHGGAKIENPVQTRRSLVTHFCPRSDEPFYRRTARFEGIAEGGVEFISQYGSIED